MKRQFKPDAYYIGTPHECIYFQFTDNVEGCRLLSEHKCVNGSYIYTLLRARKIHEKKSGEYYILLRGRRLFLKMFIRVGGPWSSFPKGHIIEY